MGPQPLQKAPLLTAEEYFEVSSEGRSELIRGEIVTMSPSGGRHGRIASTIDHLLRAFVEQHRLGVTFTADAGFILSKKPDTVRAPDVAFVVAARIPDSGIPETFFPGPPDLAVEVVSPSDRWMDVEEKVLEFLSAGTREVWVADPRHQTVRIYTCAAPARIFQKTDSLVTGLLPGFSLPLAQVFA